MDLNKSFDFDNGVVNDGAIIPESLVGTARSFKPSYSSGKLTQMIYYKSLTQTTINRICMTTYNYTGNDVTSIVTVYYDTDGSTVLQTDTTTITYNGNNISNVEVVIT